MIKVLEIISDMNIGGAGILLLNRLKHSNKKAFDTTVLIPKGSSLEKRLLSMNIKIERMKGCRDRSFDVFAISEIMGIVKRLKPDIVNCHGCLSGRIAASLSGNCVCVYTRHCCYPTSGIYRCGTVRAMSGIAVALLSDRIIAVSHSAKSNLTRMGIPPELISVIINGAEPLERASDECCERLKKSLGIPQNAIVVSIFARLEKCKDHACFLKAAKILCDESDKYRFLIVGKGSLEESLVKESKRLGIDGKVIFTGFVENISPYMSITDINVNCSVGTETSSLALSEGMSLGVPSVASDYGGNPYMVRNGVNGFIYPRGNSLLLAKSIRKLGEEKLYKRISQNARSRFEDELNAETMTRKVEKLYRELLI